MIYVCSQGHAVSVDTLIGIAINTLRPKQRVTSLQTLVVRVMTYIGPAYIQEPLPEPMVT